MLSKTFILNLNGSKCLQTIKEKFYSITSALFCRSSLILNLNLIIYFKINSRLFTGLFKQYFYAINSF